MADFADGAVPIRRCGFDQQAHATRPVAFQSHLFVLCALELAGSPQDRPLDVLTGHIFSLGRRNRGPQARVGIRVTAAEPGGNRDFPDELGEDLAAPRIGRGLLVLDGGPLRMSGHGYASPGDTGCSLLALASLAQAAAPEKLVRCGDAGSVRVGDGPRSGSTRPGENRTGREEEKRS